MKRLPVAAFGALVVATLAAFFVTQHLKVSTPLIAGVPAPSPAVINPLSGVTCGLPAQRVNHRQTFITFYLQHRADQVAVYIVDPSGEIIRTLSTGYHMGIGRRNPPGQFLWNGREDNGRVVPDGTYYYRIALLGQGRTIELTGKPITVRTVRPQPVVRSVSPSLISPPGTPVTVHYSGVGSQVGVVRIYRTDLPGKPRVVKSFRLSKQGTTTTWDGLINQRPPPAGTYLIGLDVTDSACNVGHFPRTNPPAPGSTLHAGVTVRYLAAQPSLSAVPAGTDATVFVDSRRRPYRWALRAVGRKPVLAQGGGSGVALSVHLPPAGPGVYELAIRSGADRTVVPLIAGAARGAHRASVLVVLPALTWQGENPVDDNSDGMPNTLTTGGPIALQRPLANGLPTGFPDEASLIAYLNKAHLQYDLVSDLALLGDPGAALAGRHGVVLAGSEQWLPTSVSTALRNFVQAGGHVLMAAPGSLQRGVTISGQQALDATPAAATDVFGARPGALVSGSRDLLTVISDGLHIFSGTSGAFAGVSAFQSIKPPASGSGSFAGTSPQAPSIVGFGLGRGAVVEIGVLGFGSALPGSVDFQELLARVWTLLSK